MATHQPKIEDQTTVLQDKNNNVDINMFINIHCCKSYRLQNASCTLESLIEKTLIYEVETPPPYGTQYSRGGG